MGTDEATVTMNNESFITETNNEQWNNVLKITDKIADSKADYMMNRLQANDNRKFYLKVAWRFPDHVIQSNLELALSKGRDPKKYFSWLCKRSMQ